MTSYGDPHAGDYDDGYQRPSSGRAQVPQPSYDAYGYPQEGYPSNGDYSADGGGYSYSGGYGSGGPSDGYSDRGGYSDGVSGSGGYSDGYSDGGYADRPYQAAVPAATGRASVPVVTGRASVPTAAGRASVPVSPAGRAAVPVSPAGRAVVRPAATLDDEDGGDQSRPKLTPAKKKQRAKMQKLAIAGLGVFILLAGGGMIGGSYFYDTVLPPSKLKLINSTEVFAADGTQIAKLGNEHRSEVPMSMLQQEVKHALIAGEDKNFYNHHGVDLWGVARAAWNNLTGGETQGASTITQQYARQAANDLEVTYARKLREAVMARKLEDQYSKEEILGFYLNTVYFGRGAHGIGAAAEAYFGIPPDQINKLTVAQAAVLGAVLKQPEGDNGFDPAVNPEDAKSRWEYVLNNMVENKWLAPEQRAQLKYPDPANPENPQPGELQKPRANSGGATGYTDSGTGYVINYVARELDEKGVVDYLNENGMGNWKNAGLRITTTIEPKIQAAMEAQLNRANPKATLSKERENIIGAGVAINPKTGAVVAYYGGTNNGSGTDYAGKDQPHPPASSFKMYTLAAAIANDYSIKSYWDPTALKRPPQGDDEYNLGNANREGDDSCGTYCTLEEMTVKSYNVPFFDIARKIQPKRIVEMAHKAGIRTMWTTDPIKPYDLSKPVQNRQPFDYWVGIGQYPVTVLDHASGTATFANHGVYHKPYFVRKVERKNKDGKWERIPMGDEVIKGQQVIDRAVADEVTSVLRKIPVGQYALKGGREAAGKTGTWENGMKSSPTKYVYPNTNAHVWFTGYTTQIAAAIWVGSKDENKTPIKMNTGKKDLLKEANMGSSYPKKLWKLFMDQAHSAMDYPEEKLARGSGGRLGSEDNGTGISPTPQPPTCMFPLLCPSVEPSGPGGGGGGGGGGGRPGRDDPPGGGGDGVPDVDDLFGGG